MNERRIDHLMRRELDGELTRVESEELERLLLSEPAARAERNAWRRIESGLATTRKDFDVERFAAAIDQKRRELRAAPERPLLTRFSAAFAFAALCTAALIVWNIQPHSPPAISAAAPRVKVNEERVPVEVHLTDRAAETGLVTIRF